MATKQADATDGYFSPVSLVAPAFLLALGIEPDFEFCTGGLIDLVPLSTLGGVDFYNCGTAESLIRHQAQFFDFICLCKRW
jgi:hypothetical protein